MGTKSSTLIIAEANEFLDRLQAPKSLKEVKKNIDTLSKLRDQMMDAGFNSTFTEMIAAVSKEFESESQSDLKKQLKSFREFANMKRNVLNRTRVALASHSILFNMMQRGTIYPIASYMPYNGHYLYDLIYLGEPAIRSYNSLQELLAKRSGEIDESYTVTVRLDSKKTTTFKVYSRNNLEEKIKRDYGPKAELTSIRKSEVSPPLVRRQSARVAISVAYAILAAKRVYAAQLEPKSEGTHKQYAEMLAKYKLSSDTRLDLLEGHEELKDLLYSKGLIIEEDGNSRLTPAVLASITKKRAFYNTSTIREAESQLAFDVFHYFITEPKRVRSSLPLYPGISTEINGIQYDFLSAVDVDEPLKVVTEKFELESIGPNLPGKILGAAFVHLSGKPISWCTEKFSVSEN